MLILWLFINIGVIFVKINNISFPLIAAKCEQETAIS